MASDSDSTSGRSSNTETEITSSTSDAEDAAADMVPMAAQQAALAALDRPLLSRRLRRKPNRKTVKSVESPAVTSRILKLLVRPPIGALPHLTWTLRHITQHFPASPWP